MLLALGAPSGGEEFWLADNTRAYGLIQSVTLNDKLIVLMPGGESRQIPFEDIISINFLGRPPLLVQSGTQEFRFISGGQVRGQIQSSQDDALRVQTALAGQISLPLSSLEGFVSLPLVGFTGRRAEELITYPPTPEQAAADQVLDQRGSVYGGVLRRVDQAELELYHEELVRMVPIKVPYVAGVRLADPLRAQRQNWRGDVLMRFTGRDGSSVLADLQEVQLGKWLCQPRWDASAKLKLQLDEITQVQVLGGKVQYLSQLTPVEVKEKTTLAPPQRHRMDRNCQGDVLSIVGRRYPFGIGVHADSELTFDLAGQFKEFRAEAGLATQVAPAGSVVFQVLGDGKELYASPLVRGTDEKPVEIVVPVAGVKRLTLKVTHGGDLDLGDVANWAGARVQRETQTATQPVTTMKSAGAE